MKDGYSYGSSYKLKEDALLVVQGKAQKDDFSGGLRVTAEDLFDLEALRAKYAGRLKISMNGEADAKKLQQILAPYRANGNGACKVVVRYQKNGAECEIALGDTWTGLIAASVVGGTAYCALTWRLRRSIHLQALLDSFRRGTPRPVAAPRPT